ncbi:MAG: DNA-formamidopyrimidine glycosylase family protein [Nocardioides sp.]
MPEGDAVWRTARRLDQALSGERLLATDLRVPSLATIDLSGAHVLGTTARGKHLLTRLSHPEHGALSLHTHLKMEGSWQIYRPDQRWRSARTPGQGRAHGRAGSGGRLLTRHRRTTRHRR